MKPPLKRFAVNLCTHGKLQLVHIGNLLINDIIISKFEIKSNFIAA